MIVKPYVHDVNGDIWEYRLVSSSRLERRNNTILSQWSHVDGHDFVCMTPAELRHVADVIERCCRTD